MPWEEVTKMSRKVEFVNLALAKTESFTELCSRFNISRKTGYQLLSRYQKEGLLGLEEKPRRPYESPQKTATEIEKKILEIRDWKRTWGGRKIRRFLLERGETAIPAPSTITDILRRHGYLDEKENCKHRKFIRFEHEAPNDLWQMDFKGHFEIGRGRCHPLTILDDHSRYSIGLKACSRETHDVVKNHLIDVFRNYGMPLRMNMDNGSPWACTKGSLRYTRLTIWLIRLGIRVSFSGIRHPQTNGKDERFHRTLKSELLQFNYFKTIEETQKSFNRWRDEYNMDRPHEALNLDTPIRHFQVSKRAFPERLSSIEYQDSDIVRKVDAAGKIGFSSKKFFISEALYGEYIALRKTQLEDKYDVYFCNQRITSLIK